MLIRKHYGHVFVGKPYTKKLTAPKYLKMLKLSVNFIFITQED